MQNKKFLSKSAREIAKNLENQDRSTLLTFLEDATKPVAQDVFFELSTYVIIDVFTVMNDALFVKIFTKVDTHKAARVLSRLDQHDVYKKLELLPKITSREIKDFLNYEENTAGFLMETVLFSCSKEDTVDTVLTKLRELGDRRIITIYVVDNEQKLIGRIPVNYIAIAQPEQQLDELMYKAYSVTAMATREEVLEVIEAHSLLQIPVVDINNYLLGIIRNDMVLSASRQEISGDLQTMFGASKEEHALSKSSFAVRKRLPWLQINLITAFLASMVVGVFEDTIAKITILAIFLPVVAGQSGNTGSQALAVTIRGLALKEIRIGQWLRVAKKELIVGFVNGVAVAITTGIVVFFWANSLGIAVVIGISMIISMVIAGFSGAIIPIGLKAIGQDPATSSSILLTTVTDICGFLSFLGLASALSSVLGIN
ncbi:magnesium transporter [Aquimarina sp. U1-2]|uniref:magnesium transporter n=1 Tax=Aquimarina sp. U1-2 TaxID=2823141 RepID=UPI001AECC5D5|nr:magnesium transporter [Aquimarina sp. U1-2]MBP2831644.1 magnesium transporter [Aquimarina sp. U1-2]